MGGVQAPGLSQPLGGGSRDRGLGLVPRQHRAEDDFVCVFCGSDLPVAWNVDPVA
jgi:hypothetical protein